MAVAVALTVAPGVARACSCGSDFSVLWPEMDATAVPLNTRVWVAQPWEFELSEPRLRPVGVEDSLGFLVSAIDTREGPLTVLTPDMPLAPDTAYELVDCLEGICDRVVARFTTGAAADGEAPSLPSETDRDGGADPRGLSSCGKSKWASVELSAEGLLVMEIGGGSLDPATLSGGTTIATLDPSITVGVGACYTGWPDADERALPVRYGVFDVAGNFSGWTAPDTLTLGSGCNCRSDAPATPSLFALAMVGLALRRRRRR